MSGNVIALYLIEDSSLFDKVYNANISLTIPSGVTTVTLTGKGSLDEQIYENSYTQIYTENSSITIPNEASFICCGITKTASSTPALIYDGKTYIFNTSEDIRSLSVTGGETLSLIVPEGTTVKVSYFTNTDRYFTSSGSLVIPEDVENVTLLSKCAKISGTKIAHALVSEIPIPTVAGGIVRLSNYDVLHYGGINADRTFSNKAFYFNTATKTWSTKSPMNTVRHTHAAAILGEFAYAIGGATETSVLSSVERYNFAQNTWTVINSISTPRVDAIAISNNNDSIYVIGGWNNPNVSTLGPPNKTAEKYNTATGNWSLLRAMNTPRGGNPGVIFDKNKLYVLGGLTGDTAVSKAAEYYDSSADKWISLPDMPTARTNGYYCLYDNKIYCFGGISAYGASGTQNSWIPTDAVLNNTVSIYDITTNTWSEGTTYTNANGILISSYRTDQHLCDIFGRVYFCGGMNIATRANSDKLISYDIHQGLWTETTLVTGEGLFQSFILSDSQQTLYIAGGIVDMTVPSGTDPMTLRTKTYEYEPDKPSPIKVTLDNSDEFYLYSLNEKSKTITLNDQQAHTLDLTVSDVGTCAVLFDIDQKKTYTSSVKDYLPQGLSTVTVRGKAGYVEGNNSWSSVANLPTPYRGLSTAQFANKSVIIVGGYNDTSASSVAQTLIYSPDKNTYETVGNLAIPRHATSIVVVPNGNYVYVVGGARYISGVASVLNTVERYDPYTKIWTTVGALNTARFGASAVCDKKGRVYIAGGYSDFSYSIVKTVERYDPLTNTWTILPLNVPRGGPIGLSIDDNDNIYVLGGMTSNSQIANTTEVLKNGTSAFTPISSMITSRCNFKSVIANNKLFAIGGVVSITSSLGANGFLGIGASFAYSIEYLDLETLQWNMFVTDIPLTFVNTQVTKDNGDYLYLKGGGTTTDQSPIPIYSKFIKVDPYLLTASEIISPNTPTNRTGELFFFANDKIYEMSGYVGSIGNGTSTQTGNTYSILKSPVPTKVKVENSIYTFKGLSETIYKDINIQKTQSAVPIQTNIPQNGSITISYKLLNLNNSTHTAASETITVADSTDELVIQGNALSSFTTRNWSIVDTSSPSLESSHTVDYTVEIDNKQYTYVNNKIYVFDMTTEVLTELAGFTAPSIGANGFCYDKKNGYIYIAGGYTSQGGISVSISSFYRYDIKTNVWTKLQDIPIARHWHEMVCDDDGNVYLIGGWKIFTNGSVSNVTQIDKYTLSTSQFSTIAYLPCGFYAPGVHYKDGVIYIFGGANYNSSTGIQSVHGLTYAYDLKDNVLEPIRSMNVPCYHIRSYYHEKLDRIYSFGGVRYNNNGTYTTFNVIEYLDLKTGHWVTCKTLATPLFSPGIILDKYNCFYLLGGVTDTNISTNPIKSRELQRYDPFNDTITQLPVMSIARTGQCYCSSVTGIIHAYSGGVHEKYTPETIMIPSKVTLNNKDHIFSYPDREVKVIDTLQYKNLALTIPQGANLSIQSTNKELRTRTLTGNGKENIPSYVREIKLEGRGVTSVASTVSIDGYTYSFGETLSSITVDLSSIRQDVIADFTIPVGGQITISYYIVDLTGLTTYTSVSSFATIDNNTYEFNSIAPSVKTVTLSGLTDKTLDLTIPLDGEIRVRYTK